MCYQPLRKKVKWITETITLKPVGTTLKTLRKV